MLTCPQCQSPRLESRDLGRNTGCAVGAIAGAASGAASALRGARLGATFGAFAGPAGSVLGGLAGAALGGLVGGAIGCEVGSKIGEAVDQNCLANYRCLECGHTSCDGTLATTATPTTVRVVCNNTLSIALSGTSSAIKVPHSTSFDAQAVKKQLGIAVSQWDGFMYRMKTLSERKVKSHESMNYFLKVLCQTDGHADASAGLTNERALKKVQAMYEGQGRGAELAAAKGTAWGLLCAVTEFVDHERRARSQEYRLDSAWFGQGATLKQRALEQALQLAS